MSKVYLPQLPSRFDASLQMWIPSINIQPAEEFGETFTVMPPDASRLSTKQLTKAVRERMQDFSEDDYLVCIGDPFLIALCSIVAAEMTDKVKFLRWDRMAHAYTQLEIDL